MILEYSSTFSIASERENECMKGIVDHRTAWRRNGK